MFKDLLAPLQKMGLVMTLASVPENKTKIRATLSRLVKDDEKDKKKVVLPIILTGTVEELEEGFAKVVEDFTTKTLSFEESVQKIDADLEAELKTIKEEAAKKLAEAKKISKTSTTTTRAASTRPAPKVETTTVAAPTPVMSLFDEPMTIATPVAAETSVESHASADTENDEEDIDAAHSNAD